MANKITLADIRDGSIVLATPYRWDNSEGPQICKLTNVCEQIEANGTPGAYLDDAQGRFGFCYIEAIHEVITF